MSPKPADDKVIKMIRYYTTLKASPDFKRRVTRIEPLVAGSTLYCADLTTRALVEYIGEYPGLQPHGNAKAKPGRNYQRTTKEVLDNIDQEVRLLVAFYVRSCAVVVI